MVSMNTDSIRCWCGGLHTPVEHAQLTQAPAVITARPDKIIRNEGFAPGSRASTRHDMTGSALARAGQRDLLQRLLDDVKVCGFGPLPGVVVDGGVVDQHVGAPEALADPVGHRLDAARAGDVEHAGHDGLPGRVEVPGGLLAPARVP